MSVSTLAASIIFGDRPGAAARNVWRGPEDDGQNADDNNAVTAAACTSVEVAQEASDALGCKVGLPHSVTTTRT
jgi:hypothetical protein